MNTTLVVLAAGMGSRYGGLKQVDPVGPSGEAIIDYSIYDAIRAGFQKVVFVIRRDIEDAFKTNIGDKFASRIATDYVYQELNALPPGYEVPPTRNKPWGTGHAILLAADAVSTPFGVINADDFYGSNSFSRLYQSLVDTDTSVSYEYSMVGFPLKNTLSQHGFVSRGVCETTDSNLLKRLVERTHIERKENGIVYTDSDGAFHHLTGEEIVSMNMWGFSPSVFGFLQEQFEVFLKTQITEESAEFFIPFVINSLIAEKKAQVRILSTDDSWVGITYREDREHVIQHIQELIQTGVYPIKLWVD